MLFMLKSSLSRTSKELLSSFVDGSHVIENTKLVITNQLEINLISIIKDIVQTVFNEATFDKSTSSSKPLVFTISDTSVKDDKGTFVCCVKKCGFKSVVGIIFGKEGNSCYLFGNGDREVILEKSFIMNVGVILKHFQHIAGIILTTEDKYPAKFYVDTDNFNSNASLIHYSDEETIGSVLYCNWYETLAERHIRLFQEKNESSLMKDYLNSWLDNAEVGLVDEFIKGVNKILEDMSKTKIYSKAETLKDGDYWKLPDPIKILSFLPPADLANLNAYLQLLKVTAVQKKIWTLGFNT